MSKEIQLARRIYALQEKYQRVVIELGRYYANQQGKALHSDEEAFHYGAGVYTGLIEAINEKGNHNAT